ncbi:hypothetical protein J008_05202 [Cryptococcus neoformans]|nr:hypothetical protein C362_05490 [Cryptococcus neoformans var. grubii Bt1]OXH26195.1 hypothetical protein J008_05202 [Cryptococcus neoformans var. grubii]
MSVGDFGVLRYSVSTPIPRVSLILTVWTQSGRIWKN